MLPVVSVIPIPTQAGEAIQMKSKPGNVLLKVRFPSKKGLLSADRILSVFLVMAILGAMGALGYVIANPKVEKFTEFYILGLDGKAEWYPSEFVLGGGEIVLVRYESAGGFRENQEAYGRVTSVIVNREQQQATYLVKVNINGEQTKVWLNGEEIQDIGPIGLAQGEQWRLEIGLAPQEVCGSTSLTAPAEKGQEGLWVANADRFERGDYVRIGAKGAGNVEFAPVADVDISRSLIELGTELRYNHGDGDRLMEQQMVEFVLYKDGEPYFKEGEAPHLWISVEEAQ